MGNRSVKCGKWEILTSSSASVESSLSMTGSGVEKESVSPECFVLGDVLDDGLVNREGQSVV
jgi:hypothetical protein